MPTAGCMSGLVLSGGIGDHRWFDGKERTVVGQDFDHRVSS